MRTQTNYTAAQVRALKLREVLNFRAHVGGSIPFLKRLMLEEVGIATLPVRLSGAPKVTETFTRKAPLSSYKTKEFVYRPKHTMKYIGKMDKYHFGSSIPKFDPWFRDSLRDVSPEYEEHLTAKYLRDPSTPDRVMKHFARYDQHWKPLPKSQLFKRADRLLRNMFSDLDHTITPIDFNFKGWNRIVQQLELGSSPGLPLRREFTTQGDCLPYIYDKAKRLNHFAKFLEPYKVRAPPCMIGLRPGLTEYDKLDEKVKARGVWAYPAEVKVIEMRYTIPLLERISEKFGSHPYVTGRNMTKALPMVIDHLLEPGKQAMVTDISHLDDSVGPQWIDWAFSVISRWMDFGFTKSMDERNRNVFEFLRYYFRDTLILLPSGQLLRKKGGVPSGSGFTQLVDTLVSLQVLIMGLLEQGIPESEIKGQIFAVGDDVAATVPMSFSVSRLAKFLDQLGYKINESKVYLSTNGHDLVFLGYSKHGGHVYRELNELMKQALFPERFVGSPGRSLSRLLGQHIACGMCSTTLETFIIKAFEKRLYAPLQFEDEYIYQSRWIRKTTCLSSLPNHYNAWDLFPLA